MITANTKKKKASDVMGIQPAKTSGIEGINSEDMGEMKLKAIMGKIGSDRELESVKDAAHEARELTDKFKKNPSEAMDSMPAYREKLEKLRRRGK